MGRGPGHVERVILEVLRDPELTRVSSTLLCARVFGARQREVTKSQRVSVLRAIRRVLSREAGWRIVHRPITPHEPGSVMVGGKRGAGPRETVILERVETKARKDRFEVNEPIWAYKDEGLGKPLKWRRATVVRRTQWQATVEFEGERISCDDMLNPRDARLMLNMEWRFTNDRARTEERRKRRRAMEGVEDGAPNAIALELLGLLSDFTDADVLRAFRARSFQLHPDQGGDAMTFRALVMARDALLLGRGD
jgi:hypothetical protein